MSTGMTVGPARARRGALSRVLLLAVASLLLFAVTTTFAPGCTSEEDLVQTLSTTQDPAQRQNAAADLANLHSLRATKRLIEAAGTDATAAAGLEALRDEYIKLMSTTIQKARDAGKELGARTMLELAIVVDCLACIGDTTALDALGALVCEPEQLKAKPGAAGSTVPNTLSLQLHTLDVLAGLNTETAYSELLKAATLAGNASSTETIRADARDDLAAGGEQAVNALVTALGQGDWVTETLVKIGAPAVSQIGEQLTSATPAVRYAALEVLLRLYQNDPTTVAPTLVRPERVSLLVDAYGHAAYDDQVKGAIETVLVKIGQPAVSALVPLLANGNWAYRVLTEIGADAVPGLVAVLGTSESAGDTLVDIGAAAVPAVAAELDNPDETVQQRALGVLLSLYWKDEPKATSVLVTEDMVPTFVETLTKNRFNDVRDSAAMAALIEIGEPAKKALLKLIADNDWSWDLLVGLGARAVPLLTSMLSEGERDTRLAAAKALVDIHDASPDAVATLTADLQQKNLEAIALNYLYYIRLGQAGTEEVLGKALLSYGKRQMAVDYLNCGSTALYDSAVEWGKARGLSVYTYTTTESVDRPIWGK